MHISNLVFPLHGISCQINIASFALGRVRTGGVAMSCLNLDTPCTEKMLEEIRKIPDIRNVVQVGVGLALLPDPSILILRRALLYS